ncbi:hypothetical protein HAX54_049024, partial [Datura stramonium]|nr:hypothetical protein [Datura stramonium]
SNNFGNRSSNPYVPPRGQESNSHNWREGPSQYQGISNLEANQYIGEEVVVEDEEVEVDIPNAEGIVFQESHELKEGGINHRNSAKKANRWTANPRCDPYFNLDSN